MSWHFLERWLEKANQHSTLIGKFWITFLIICRMIIIGSLGDRVYADEQSEFKCNSAQMGCNNVCFNKFSPISHLRFWGFQMIIVTLPSIIFLIYTGHKTKEAMEKNKADIMNKKREVLLKKQIEKNVEGQNQGQVNSFLFGGVQNLRSRQFMSRSSVIEPDHLDKTPLYKYNKAGQIYPAPDTILENNISAQFSHPLLNLSRNSIAQRARISALYEKDSKPLYGSNRLSSDRPLIHSAPIINSNRNECVLNFPNSNLRGRDETIDSHLRIQLGRAIMAIRLMMKVYEGRPSWVRVRVGAADGHNGHDNGSKQLDP